MSERQTGTPARQLSVHDHSRDSAGLRYVGPVVSRRAGGVSVGIKLNVNNACNWACIYCQVPGLARGGPPAVNLDLLEAELRGLLGEIVLGDYLQQHVPEGARRLVDVAFSGNGEPTAAREFEAAVGRVVAVLAELLPGGGLPLRLISNGSLLHRPGVQRGIAQLGACGGEVWFKLDRASPAGVRAVNGVRQRPERALEALSLCADLGANLLFRARRRLALVRGATRLSHRFIQCSRQDKGRAPLRGGTPFDAAGGRAPIGGALVRAGAVCGGDRRAGAAGDGQRIRRDRRRERLLRPLSSRPWPTSSGF